MIKPPELSATLTTRERFAQHSTDPACAGCHHLMDPIGLGFENFDGAGALPRRPRTASRSTTRGEVEDSDVDGPFDGAVELAQKLASQRRRSRACVATQWFRYGYGRARDRRRRLQPERDPGAGSRRGGYKIRDLLVALTRDRRVPLPPGHAAGGR